MEPNSDLHALLNEGHCKGATVWRVLGEGNELREFSVFSAVAYAVNGKLPDDLQQRSLTIMLQRKLAGETAEELREDRVEHFRDIARMCARWSDDVDVGDDPDMGGIINRNADNWRPLFAIADAIGDDWSERIRVAASHFLPREDDAIGPMILSDIKSVFDYRTFDRVSSAELCSYLRDMEGKPWADWRGKELTPNHLARLLKPFDIITNTTIRVGDKTAKGYLRQQFEEAWTRYLVNHYAQEGQKPAFERSQGNNADEMGTSTPFQKVTDKGDVTDRKVTATDGVTFQTCEKPPSNGHCYRVTDGKPENGECVREEVCVHCGEPGVLYPIAFGAVEGIVHAGCPSTNL